MKRASELRPIINNFLLFKNKESSAGLHTREKLPVYLVLIASISYNSEFGENRLNARPLNLTVISMRKIPHRRWLQIGLSFVETEMVIALLNLLLRPFYGSVVKTLVP